MYCSNCGRQIDNRAIICIYCGCAVNNYLSRPEDVPSVGLNILSFLIPIVGLILYATHYKETPNKATSMLTWAIVSMVLSAFFYGCALML